MQAWTYPATLHVEADDDYTFQIVDVPEAICGATTLEKARALAAEVLDFAVRIRLERGEPVPPPSEAKPGEEVVALDPTTAARAALAQAMEVDQLTNVALAKRLGRTEGAVRRLVSGRGRVKIGTVLEALAATGRKGVFATL